MVGVPHGHGADQRADRHLLVHVEHGRAVKLGLVVVEVRLVHDDLSRDTERERESMRQVSVRFVVAVPDRLVWSGIVRFVKAVTVTVLG